MAVRRGAAEEEVQGPGTVAVRIERDPWWQIAKNHRRASSLIPPLLVYLLVLCVMRVPGGALSCMLHRIVRSVRAWGRGGGRAGMWGGGGGRGRILGRASP